MAHRIMMFNHSVLSTCGGMCNSIQSSHTIKHGFLSPKVLEVVIQSPLNGLYVHSGVMMIQKRYGILIVWHADSEQVDID